MGEETNGPKKKRNSRKTPGGSEKKGRRAEETNSDQRTNQYFEPEIHHPPFKDKSRRPLSSEALGDFEIDGE
jgi:hypothetical protein